MSGITTSMLEKVNRYVGHKRGLGCKFDTQSYLLQTFAKHADRHAPGKPLTVALALEWASAPNTRSRTYHANRLNALRSFARYLAIFEPETEIPPHRILGPSYARVVPHIYTDEQTIALMRAAMTTKVLGKRIRTNPIRNATIIGLLACTGMRIGEVLALENRDVDLALGIITVRQSKNLPVRLVPITDSTITHLREYEKARDRCFGRIPESAAFIQSSRGGRLMRSSFSHSFGNILERAGLKHETASRPKPRVHDFRHTFACNHLLRAYRDDRDIDNAVHELSVYLGHANIQSTYWYLTGVPVLFEQCLKRLKPLPRECRQGGNT